eukprot:TRINITY_DN6132_c0_g2_i2.p1 TRINITY_DN6132_c0_g2~~TRINITY_DN6132_c0_g2_i2.p1  ORF type:complete len:416 (-),score=24.81 TRINITY_DN6132_c0_g2_i2:1341-2477(-)
MHAQIQHTIAATSWVVSLVSSQAIDCITQISLSVSTSMCGRARCSLAPSDLAKTVKIPEERWRDKDKFNPSFNVSPGFYVPIIKTSQDGQSELHTMKWGLIPSFTKSDEKPNHYRMFNARSETVDSKPVFKRLMSRNRCLVVLNGFYEWKTEAAGKQPYYVYLNKYKEQSSEQESGNMEEQEQEEVIYMAGLYDMWKQSEDDEPLYSFTILTTDCSKRIEWLHNRMPVILRSQSEQLTWLGQQQESETKQTSSLNSLYTPYNELDLKWYPVTKAMSNSKYQQTDCAVDIRTKGIGKLLSQQIRGSKHKQSDQKQNVEEKQDVKKVKVAQDADKDEIKLKQNQPQEYQNLSQDVSQKSSQKRQQKNRGQNSITNYFKKK